MAPRTLISLEDISLTFGGKPLFNDIRLHIAEGDKICLVGKNGAGKTTLMRLITGDLEPDKGKRFALPGLSIGYLAQSVHYNAEDTVVEFVLQGLKPEERTIDKTHLAERIITPLQLNPTALLSTLSGGQLRRAALAQALIEEPDILLLDEPTNHLDLESIEWLEQHISGMRSALLCVSHDRTFLSNISRKIFWIDRGQIRTNPQGYKHFEAWADGILEQEARALHNMQKKMEAEIDWTQGGVSARRKRNQRRLRELNNLREKLRNDKASYLQQKRTIDIDPLQPTLASKIVAEFKHVNKSFRTQEGKELPILKDLNLRILRGDRIGILGKNGSGKSTFLKLLTGELEPDEGRIFKGKTIDISYFDQNRSFLNPKKSLWDTLCPDGGNYVMLGSKDTPKPVHVCGYLKQFLFDPRIARDLVGTLSGGQQNRLMLARTLALPGNVLILDEPTNDLDMDTLDMLQEILADYQGTLILVSHDRDFLDRTVTEILAFEGDGVVEEHIGGYSDYLAFKRKSAQPAKEAKNAPNAKEATAPKKSSAKMTFKLKHELEQLPARMEQLEAEIAQLKETLSNADLYTSNPDLFDQTSRRLPLAQAELEESEHRWLELEEMRGEN